MQQATSGNRKPIVTVIERGSAKERLRRAACGSVWVRARSKGFDHKLQYSNIAILSLIAQRRLTIGRSRTSHHRAGVSIVVPRRGCSKSRPIGCSVPDTRFAQADIRGQE